MTDDPAAIRARMAETRRALAGAFGALRGRLVGGTEPTHTGGPTVAKATTGKAGSQTGKKPVGRTMSMKSGKGGGAAVARGTAKAKAGAARTTAGKASGTAKGKAGGAATAKKAAGAKASAARTTKAVGGKASGTKKAAGAKKGTTRRKKAPGVIEAALDKAKELAVEVGRGALAGAAEVVGEKVGQAGEQTKQAAEDVRPDGGDKGDRSRGQG